MSSSPHIVPPKPTERRLLRRKKAWFFGWAGCALTGLSLLLFFAQDGEEIISWYWMVGCLCLAVISGILALVLRFTEQPREVTVRRFPDWPGEPPVIHLKR